MSDMSRVSRQYPCPVCGKDSWCLLGKSIIICMRQESPQPKEFKGGEIGWIHHYGGPPRKLPPTLPPAPTINTTKVLAEWKRNHPNSNLPFLARNLSVSVDALIALECQKADIQETWGFPMRDGYGSYTGIRLRRLDGTKWAVTGSRAGIFIPHFERPTRRIKRILVVEGPTDTAAALTMGYHAIGRPSCSGGVPHILAFVRNHGVQEVVVVADNDDPGIRGAKGLQEMLPVSSCVLVLPTKDLREFLQVGDKSTIDLMIDQLVWTTQREVV